MVQIESNDWFRLILTAENMQMQIGELVADLQSASKDTDIEPNEFLRVKQLVNRMSYEADDTCETIRDILDV